MNFSLNEVSALLKVAASAGIDPRALTRLLSLEILDSLGQNRYAVSIEGKALQAQSDKPLPDRGQFWAKVSTAPSKLPQIHSLIAKPHLLQSLAMLPLRYEPDELVRLLKGGAALDGIKSDLLEHLAASASKEEFSALTQLTMSLHHGILTLPLFYERYLGFFQMKKRYNKKQQKASVDFYAALQHLGPIEGSLTFIAQEQVDVELRIRFETTISFLEKHVKHLPSFMHLRMQHSDRVEPLFEPRDTLLDVSI